MRLQESGEMYLETILVLSEERSYVRAVDVGEYMGFSKPSVSRAMRLLREAGYVQTDENGFLQLTESGKARAKKIYERHTVLSEYLKKIGVSDEVAVDDACKLEHYMSDETFEALRRQLEAIS